MVDTICLKHICIRPTAIMLETLGAVRKRGLRNPTWLLNPAQGSALPRITIVQTPDSVFHVYAECSIPWLLYGHNARLPASTAELQLGINLLCREVERILGIDFDPVTAVITKLHLARDYYTGDAANNAVFALYDRRIRYHPIRVLTSSDIEATTLYFNCESKRRNSVICIYPKLAEVLSRHGSHDAIEAAQGNLRIEYRANTLAGVRSLKKRYGVEDDRELLTSEFNDYVIQTLERELRFPACIDDKETPLTRLLKMYSPRKAQRLLGFLELRKLKGDSELTKTPQARRNFHSARRDCERAGVWIIHQQTEE